MKTFEQAEKQLKEKLENAGATLMEIRYLTTHPDDRYLFAVMTNNLKLAGEYAVHLYNSEFDELSEGYYTRDIKLAEEKFRNKR
jgi:hypothetical protein